MLRRLHDGADDACQRADHADDEGHALDLARDFRQDEVPLPQHCEVAHCLAPPLGCCGVDCFGCTFGETPLGLACGSPAAPGAVGRSPRVPLSGAGRSAFGFCASKLRISAGTSFTLACWLNWRTRMYAAIAQRSSAGTCCA